MRLRRYALVFGLAALPGSIGAQEVSATSLGRVRATFSEPFSRVAAVREEPDGRVLVLDDIENRIVRVDLRAMTATPLGRQGRGPGEYTLPLDLLALPGDTTLAVDMTGGGRALLIVTRGATDGRIGANGFEPGAPLFFRPDVQSDARGNLYELVMLTSPADRQEGYSGVRRLNRASGRLDTIGRVSQRVRSPLVRPVAPSPANGGQRRAGGPPPPYATVDQWAVAPDGRIAIVTTDPYRVRFVDPTGRVVEGPPISYRAVPMSVELKAEWRQRQEQPVATLQMGAGGAMTAGWVRRPYQEPPEWPDVLPPFFGRALRFAPDGMLWIERLGPAGAGQLFDVVDARGQLARRVALSPKMRVVGFGRNGVYTVRRDTDDLEYLQLQDTQP